jgi:hypothetical protein
MHRDKMVLQNNLYMQCLAPLLAGIPVLNIAVLVDCMLTTKQLVDLMLRKGCMLMLHH